MTGESETLLNEINLKYKHEQKALFDAMFNDWTLGNCDMDVVLHNNSSWHGIDKSQVHEVHQDFIKLVQTHQQESEENFDLTRTPWEKNIPK